MTNATHAPEAPNFWDRIAPKYAQKPVADQAAYAQKLKRLSSLLRRTDHVLEIGCGTGSTALQLADSVASITGTDISRGMINIAQAKLGPGAPINVTFQQADALAEREDQTFDAICAFSLLHLVDDLSSVLAQVYRQLRPGGLFISKTVCLEEASFFIRALIPALHALGVAPKVTSFGVEDLTRQIEDAGFRIEDVSHFGPNRRNPFIVARRAAC